MMKLVKNTLIGDIQSARIRQFNRPMTVIDADAQLKDDSTLLRYVCTNALPFIASKAELFLRAGLGYHMVWYFMLYSGKQYFNDFRLFDINFIYCRNYYVSCHITPYHTERYASVLEDLMHAIYDLTDIDAKYVLNPVVDSLTALVLNINPNSVSKRCYKA